MLSESPSTSESLASTSIVATVSSSVLAESFTATGASFIDPTVTFTVALAVPLLPSLMV